MIVYILLGIIIYARRRKSGRICNNGQIGVWEIGQEQRRGGFFSVFDRISEGRKREADKPVERSEVEIKDERVRS